MKAKAPKAGPKDSRGRLMSMRVSDGVRAFVLDQLAGVRGLRPKAMFGGIGLYADDIFFGILAADTLYFKVDDVNRAAYESAGMKPFKPYADRPMTMPYYQVPADVLEDAEELAGWARVSISIASAKPKKARTARRSRT